MNLYPYQKQAVEFAIARDGAALFLEQGLGKTYITAGIIERLIKPNFLGLIVVPLANIETTWVRVLSEVGITVGTSWTEFKKRRLNSATVLLLNYEAVHALIKRLRKVPWSLVVYDESQRIKGRGTKQSRDAAKLAYAEHRVILSGTPVEQAPQDLWPQFRFALPDVFGTRWQSFDTTWLNRVGFMGYKREFKWDRLPKFLEHIQPHILRLTKKEALHLPALRIIKAPVELLGDQARIYADLEDDFYTTVNGREVVADMVMTQLIRLQQVCGGFVRTDPKLDELKGEIVKVGNAKLRKLISIVRREDSPIVVFCKYIPEIQDIVKYYQQYPDTRVGVITGKTRKTRTKTIEAFQSGQIDLLICQIRTGGVGIDLYRAHVGITYSLTYSFIDYDQAISRIHRHGQSHEVRIYLIYARNTVDETIYSRILSKQLVTKRVLKGRQKMAKLEKAKKEEKAAPAKEEKAPAADKPKYGVAELAEALGIKPASVRVRLRNAEIAKSGKSYGWNTQKEFNEVVKAMKESKKEEEAAA